MILKYNCTKRYLCYEHSLWLILLNSKPEDSIMISIIIASTTNFVNYFTIIIMVCYSMCMAVYRSTVNVAINV